MSLIVGLDDFGEAVHSRLNFIDKSLFIKEILDNTYEAYSGDYPPAPFWQNV